MPIMSANRIEAQPVSWLWPGRIPLGKLVVLEGNPDLGKSLLALDWCARLSSGRPFPDSESSTGPANALVLSAEDAAGDTIVPRLHGLGADLSRVFVWQGEDEEEWPWRFPGQAKRLEAALSETGARLAVIDPFLAFLGEGVQYGSDPSMRQALRPLVRLAAKYQCAILLQRHLNKGGGGQALYRGLGSVAIVAACRYAMLVERDPEDASRCVLATVRHSLSVAPPSLVYQITAGTPGVRSQMLEVRSQVSGIRSPDSEAKPGAADCCLMTPDSLFGGLPTVRWLGRSPYTANELLMAAGRKCTPRDEAADFLEKMLAGGPRTFSEIRKAAKKARLSFRTVERAKKALGIRSQREYRQGEPVSYWLLEDQELAAEHYDDYVVDQMIRKLRAGLPGYPPRDEEEEEE
jgi:hypothetical protein